MKEANRRTHNAIRYNFHYQYLLITTIMTTHQPFFKVVHPLLRVVGCCRGVMCAVCGY